MEQFIVRCNINGQSLSDVGQYFRHKLDFNQISHLLSHPSDPHASVAFIMNRGCDRKAL